MTSTCTNSYGLLIGLLGPCWLAQWDCTQENILSSPRKHRGIYEIQAHLTSNLCPGQTYQAKEISHIDVPALHQSQVCDYSNMSHHTSIAQILTCMSVVRILTGPMATYKAFRGWILRRWWLNSGLTVSSADFEVCGRQWQHRWCSTTHAYSL